MSSKLIDGSVLIVAHGSDVAGGHEYEDLKEFLSGAVGEDSVHICYLKSGPSVKDIIPELKTNKVFVMPFLLAKGHHFYEDIKNGENSIIRILEAQGFEVHFDDKGLLEYEDIKKAILNIIFKSYRLS